ncbi:MAG: crossover junction endodeoxyribonuclease RuvC [bacterium]
MIILGIDPGTAITGWGVIEAQDKIPGRGDRMQAVDYGCIKTDNQTDFPRRLETIYRELNSIIKKYHPDEAAVEELFFAKNVKTALTVGQARGVVILAAVNAGLKIAEYTPLQVKQALSGYGRAEKQQIQKMVKVFLCLKDIPKPDDVADALAVAICHINSRKIKNVYERIKER